METVVNSGEGQSVQEHDAPGEVTFEQSLHEFLDGVAHLLNGKSEAKGYSHNGNGRPLFDAVFSVADYGHAHGEILYKLTRFRALENEEDLRKVAAWAFLMWDRHRRQGEIRSS
jgi:hypothetical protein